MARVDHARRGGSARARKCQRHRLDADRYRAPAELPQEAPLRAEVGDGGGFNGDDRRAPSLHPLPCSLPIFPHQANASFLLLLAALAWHVGIATKSLAHDLGIGKRTRDIMRAAYVLAVFALVVLVLVAS